MELTKESEILNICWKPDKSEAKASQRKSSDSNEADTRLRRTANFQPASKPSN